MCKHAYQITDASSGEVICSKCGLVLAEKSVDTGPETRSFDPEEFAAKARTGAGFTLAFHDKGLFTFIGSQNRDVTGKILTADMKYKLRRLRMLDSRSKMYGRTSIVAFSTLDSVSTKLVIPNVAVEEAAYLFRKATAKGLTHGRNTIALLCAALYAACKESDVPRTLNDIADAANIRKKDLVRDYAFLIKALELQLPPFDASEFVSRIAARLEIGEKSSRDAIKILSEASEKEVSAGKNPIALAATALYLACRQNNEDKTQSEIAKAAGITTVTIRNRLCSLRKLQGQT
ncbi:MAG: transcription initiation factor IIB [Thaumarchaeota archaeon]|nr:transcription initiation factor IIB [Nitrososphaerota archaeon]